MVQTRVSGAPTERLDANTTPATLSGQPHAGSPQHTAAITPAAAPDCAPSDHPADVAPVLGSRRTDPSSSAVPTSKHTPAGEACTLDASLNALDSRCTATIPKHSGAQQAACAAGTAPALEHALTDDHATPDASASRGHSNADAITLDDSPVLLATSPVRPRSADPVEQAVSHRPASCIDLTDEGPASQVPSHFPEVC
jgi:hypothetical protein